MKLWWAGICLCLSGCVTTVITHHGSDDEGEMPLPPVVPVTKPVVKTVTKEKIVKVPVPAPAKSTCPRFMLPAIPEVPPLLVLDDRDSVKAREEKMANYIRLLRQRYTTTLNAVNQSYVTYNSKCK